MALYFSSRQDFQVDFLVGDYGQQPLETHQNISLHRLKYLRPEATPNPLHKVLKIVYLLKSLLFQPSDIYITKTASEILGWLVLVCKWMRGKKVVFRLGSDRDTDLAYWKKRSTRLYLLYKLGLYNCDQILCQSDTQQAQLYRNSRLIGKVIKNVFRMETCHTHIKESILWVSRCMALKRPLLFLELAKRIPDENFVMIMPVNRESKVYSGEGITDLSRRVAEEAQQIPNLKLIESVPFNEIQSYYNHAKLFVNTSEFEGFPNSFIQACLGKTGILSLKVDPDGFISKNNLGLCCSDDFEAAVSFIQNLNGSTIYQYGRNAFDYVSDNHDIQKIAPKYVRLFEKLVGRTEDEKENKYREEVLLMADCGLKLSFSGMNASGYDMSSAESAGMEQVEQADANRTKHNGEVVGCFMKKSRNAGKEPVEQTTVSRNAGKEPSKQTPASRSAGKEPGKQTTTNQTKQVSETAETLKKTSPISDAKSIGQTPAKYPKKSRYTAVYRLKTILGNDPRRRENKAL